MSSRREFIKHLLALSALGSSSLSTVSYGKAVRSGHFSTGVVLDPLFFNHDMDDHPETAQRLVAINNEMEKQDIWSQLTPVESRLATNEELLLAHTQSYIDEIEILSDSGGGFYEPYQGDTYLNASSFDAAKMAAGSNINLNLAIYDRKIDHGFALLRPPGHHALQNKAMGFCIFNSDIIAARALQKYRGVKRIAIIDFDVHHGNGTQDLSDNDPSIMAISIHQHPFWPMTGGHTFTGKDDAKGTVVNCPFPKGAGDQAYLNVYDQVIHPKLEDFKPEHIIVFAGYDAHWQDPLAQHQVSVVGFNQLVDKCLNSAKELCGGRISFSLGGGYNLNPLAKCTVGTFHTLLNNSEKKIDPIGQAPTPEVDYQQRIQQLAMHHL